jgi:hypothetical protein
VNEDEIRSIVREVIRRRIASGPPVVVAAPPVCVPVEAHPSHARLTLVVGADDGPCLVEPQVVCIHCGYCLSRGH